MGAVRRLVLRLRNVFRPGAADDEAAREIAAHLALLEDEYVRRGMTPDEAHRAARLALGGTSQIQDIHRDARALVWIEDLHRDVRYALRSFARTPAFSIVAIVTLALGIGANAAIFSVVQAVVLSPLPYKQPERLVQLFENVPPGETPRKQALRTGIFAPEFVEIAGRARTVSYVSTQGFASVIVAGGLDTERHQLNAVSVSTFAMLGAQPAIGRVFETGDDQPGRDRLVILSYGAWQRYFGGDPLAIGKTLTFAGSDFNGKVTFGTPYTIIGVMRGGFHFPSDEAQFWIPLAVSAAPQPHPARIPTYARLAEGASPTAAATEIATIVEAARGLAPGSYAGAGGPPRFEFEVLHDAETESVRPAVLVLTLAVGCVLLIACANVANLLLARTAARQREIAVRIALGAGRGRLVRQVLTESLALASIGGALGVALAAAGVRVFRVLGTSLTRVDLGSTGTTFPRLDAIAIDRPVLIFAAAITLGTGVLFGLAPALRFSDGAVLAPRRDRLRGTLVVAEIALATVLLVAGGLLARSFVRLARVDLGYDPTNVVTFQVSVPGAVRPPPQLKMIAESMTDRFRAVPGVQFAGYANTLPLVGLRNSISFGSAPSDPYMPPRPDSPDVRLVSRDYIQAMGIRIVSGRLFNAGDDVGRPRVVVINEKLARREFNGKNPIGVIVYVGFTPVPWQIVGVVRDVRQGGLDQEPRPQVFIDMRQWTGPGVPIFPVGTYYSVRTADVAPVLANIHAIVQQQEGGASLENVATMEQIVSNSVTVPRMYAILLGIFAGVAMTLAAAGIYGVIAYSVSRRTREIGIRMALGARERQVVALVIRQSVVLIAVGLALGLGGAAAVTRYLTGLLFGLTPLDPATFAGVAAAFAAVALLASYVPARRATHVDPLDALRCE